MDDRSASPVLMQRAGQGVRGIGVKLSNPFLTQYPILNKEYPTDQGKSRIVIGGRSCQK